MSPATPVRRAPLLAATSLLLACGPGHAKVATIEPSASPAAGIPVPAVDVSVVDPGSEPRAPLRYRVRAGQREALLLEVAVQLKLVVGDLAPAAPNPAVRVSMSVRARSGTPRLELEGKISKMEVLDDPAVSPGLVAALRGDLDRLAGLEWTALYTELGHLELLTLPAPADANPQLQKTLDWIRESLRLLLPPLPLTPVGKNARWQARRTTTIATARIEETAIYKWSGSELAVTLGMDAREQPLTPGTPPGTALVLTSFEGGGKGQIELALDHIVQPTTLRWAASGKGTATPAGEPPAPITLGLESAVTISSPASARGRSGGGR